MNELLTKVRAIVLKQKKKKSWSINLKHMEGCIKYNNIVKKKENN